MEILISNWNLCKYKYKDFLNIIFQTNASPITMEHSLFWPNFNYKSDIIFLLLVYTIEVVFYSKKLAILSLSMNDRTNYLWLIALLPPNMLCVKMDLSCITDFLVIFIFWKLICWCHFFFTNTASFLFSFICRYIFNIGINMWCEMMCNVISFNESYQLIANLWTILYNYKNIFSSPFMNKSMTIWINFKFKIDILERK